MPHIMKITADDFIISVPDGKKFAINSHGLEEIEPTGERKPLALVNLHTLHADFGELKVLKHGHWEDCGYGWKQCSICKASAYEDRFGDPICSKFCPECGAIMDEVIEDVQQETEG